MLKNHCTNLALLHEHCLIIVTCIVWVRHLLRKLTLTPIRSSYQLAQKSIPISKESRFKILVNCMTKCNFTCTQNIAMLYTLNISWNVSSRLIIVRLQLLKALKQHHTENKVNEKAPATCIFLSSHNFFGMFFVIQIKRSILMFRKELWGGTWFWALEGRKKTFVGSSCLKWLNRATNLLRK